MLLLAISAAFGGLKRAADETPQVDAGKAIDTGRYEVTIQRVVTVKDLKPLYSPDDGGALIAVVTKLKVTDDTGVTPPGDLVRLIGVPGIKDDDPPLGTTNIRDQTRDPVLTPRLGLQELVGGIEGKERQQRRQRVDRPVLLAWLHTIGGEHPLCDGTAVEGEFAS